MTTTTKATASPNEVWRRAEQNAKATALEWEYFYHVVLPLAERGYPRPKAQALLIPGRRYRWDYAWIENGIRLAVEVQGGIWQDKSGHTTGRGITRDAAKLNELSCIGWRCLFVTAAQIASGEALDWTERALRAAGSRAG